MVHCTFENGNQASLRHVTADTIVVADGKILLVKRAKGLLGAGQWALPGGYIERGETIKAGAIRETLEETGWKLKDVMLFQINDNPNRPHEDRQNVTFIYIATAAQKSGDADSESDEQRWFDLTDLPSDEQIAFDHSSCIRLYREHLASPFRLPIVG